VAELRQQFVLSVTAVVIPLYGAFALRASRACACDAEFERMGNVLRSHNARVNVDKLSSDRFFDVRVCTAGRAWFHFRASMRVDARAV
jgi:hypothetical protein